MRFVRGCPHRRSRADANRPWIRCAPPVGGSQIHSGRSGDRASDRSAGHPDADVLAHAICDALLGAAALGDLGGHYPDTDDRWKNADSMELLGHCGAEVRRAGYRIENIDATIVVQQPKLASYIQGMRQNIAGRLGLSLAQISVKAKTSEGMGYTERWERHRGICGDAAITDVTGCRWRSYRTNYMQHQRWGFWTDAPPAGRS